MNYLILINKENPIDDSYYNNVKFVNCKDSLGKEIKIEKETYDAYLKLKKYLEKKEIYILIDTAYRDFDQQQEIINDYTNKYGVEYMKKYVAPVRTSEHHTGLAIDLAIKDKNKINIEPDDLFKHEEVFLKIHKYLSQFGFILRYLKGKESITGYNYEPWHIRYVGVDVANKIYKQDQTLEEYLKTVDR